MEETKDIYMKINKETGELTEFYGRVITEEQEKAIQAKRKKKMNEENQGEFIWALFTYCSELFPDLSHSSIARLFYLATFVEYDGSRLTDDNGYTFLGKRQIKRKLNLTDKPFTTFWNEMIDNQILFEDDAHNVVINTSLFRKGPLDHKCKKDFTRVYCQCVRYVYENTKNQRDHAKLAYVFKIIPFVNRKTNIVSYNPEEQDDKKINPMTVGDFCDAIGYNRTNASRLFKELMKFTVKGKHLLCLVAMHKLVFSGMFIIVNPEIYYGGAGHHDAQFIFDVCDKQETEMDNKEKQN